MNRIDSSERIFLYLLGALIIIIGMAGMFSSCSCTPTPILPDTTPDPNTPPAHMIAFWDIPQDPGWTANSTWMHHYHDEYGNHVDDSLVVYFAAHFTEQLTPPEAPEYCAIYHFWYDYFDATDERVYLFVRWYEKYRCDIPYWSDVEAPC